MRAVKAETKEGRHDDVSFGRCIGDFGIPVFHRFGWCYRPEASSLNRVSTGQAFRPASSKRYRNLRNERNHEVDSPSRLVSHSKSPSSLDRVPSDSVRTMAGSLAAVSLDLSAYPTAAASAVNSRLAREEF
jgi:hypothetical protein